MTFYCDIQIRAASWHVDPEPAEFCEAEVEHEDDACPEHNYDDRSDASYGDYLESLREP